MYHTPQNQLTSANSEKKRTEQGYISIKQAKLVGTLVCAGQE